MAWNCSLRARDGICRCFINAKTELKARNTNKNPKPIQWSSQKNPHLILAICHLGPGSGTPRRRLRRRGMVGVERFMFDIFIVFIMFIVGVERIMLDIFIVFIMFIVGVERIMLDIFIMFIVGVGRLTLDILLLAAALDQYLLHQTWTLMYLLTSTEKNKTHSINRTDATNVKVVFLSKLFFPPTLILWQVIRSYTNMLTQTMRNSIYCCHDNILVHALVGCCVQYCQKW